MNPLTKARILMKLTALILKGDIDMKNWKTTASGLLAAAGQILGIFGVDPQVGQAISVLGLFLIGLFAKDSNVTGGTVKQ